MEEAIVLVRSILGLTRSNVRPLAYAIDLAAQYLFVYRMDKNDIFVTKYIYPAAAKEFGVRKPETVGKRIERLANRCWDALCADRSKMLLYIGKEIPPGEPSELIFALAYYHHFKEPFYQVIARDPALAF